MADRFCRNCGAPLSEGAVMCKYCLTPVGADALDGAGSGNGAVDLVKHKDRENGAAGHAGTVGMEKKDFGKEDGIRRLLNPDMIYAVMAYLGLAVLVPILLRLNVKFVRFHVNQGLVLFLAESLLAVLYGFVGGIPILAMIVSLLRLLCLGLMVLGAVSAVRGSEKPLPVVGKIHLIKM